MVLLARSWVVPVVTFLVLSEIRVSSAALECMSCRNSPSIAECRRTTIKCTDDQECFLEKLTTTQLAIAYTAGCRNKSVCNIMAALGSLRAGRKRSNLLNCAYCCGTEMDDSGPCNVHLCS
ncbi:uncharacterized protein LOC128178471 [Crassostrea angulata]|uniref:uncharacterized protein LOC128178471 n=1 Tax=Magallana angulata TaxID=2784310 RepID=UPI0022B1641C|nr:uncharacterized protein LOC128178471 [Crassostrea angulata]